MGFPTNAFPSGNEFSEVVKKDLFYGNQGRTNRESTKFYKVKLYTSIHICLHDHYVLCPSSGFGLHTPLLLTNAEEESDAPNLAATA